MSQEYSTTHALAAVYNYDQANKDWKPADSGRCRLDVYFDPVRKTSRIVAMDNTTHQVVINTNIFPGMVYQKVTEVFHQFADKQRAYGLNFASTTSAAKFAEGLYESQQKAKEVMEQAAKRREAADASAAQEAARLEEQKREELRRQEERRILEEKRAAEAEEKRKKEEEERRRNEEIRRKQEEERRLEEQRRKAEEHRRAMEQQRIMDEQRQRAASDERRRQDELKRLEDEKRMKEEADRIAAQERANLEQLEEKEQLRLMLERTELPPFDTQDGDPKKNRPKKKKGKKKGKKSSLSRARPAGPVDNTPITKEWLEDFKEDLLAIIREEIREEMQKLKMELMQPHSLNNSDPNKFVGRSDALMGKAMGNFV